MRSFFEYIWLLFLRITWRGINYQLSSKSGLSFGRECRFYGRPNIKINAHGSIVIGDDCTFISSNHVSALGVCHPVLLRADSHSRLIIGNSVGITGGSIYCSNRIEIGDGTQIGAGVMIMDTDFHHTDVSKNKSEVISASVYSSPTIVGRNVFIGARSIILKGVIIGDNSVIGAGSVVAKSVAQDSVVAGNPARLIRN